MKPTILIVEDDRSTVSLFMIILSKLNATVTTASDGQSALDILESSEPDVIILDLGLPGKNGLDILEYIRATPRLDKTKVIVISAYTDLAGKINHDRVEAVLTKPITASAFLQTVQDAL